MLEMPIADGPVETFELRPDDRATRGAAASPPPVSATIELTRPLATPLTEALTAGDPELAAFWKAEQGRFDYDHVTFRIGFSAPDGSVLDRAWVAVRLGDDPAGTGAIAWSMTPDKVMDPSRLKQTAKLGLDFKFVKAEVGEEREAPDACFLRAERAQTSRPHWSFQPTEDAPLAGSYHLSLVVRRSAGLAVAAEVSASVSINRWKYLIFRTTDEASPAAVAFVLPPAA